jgi:hypothetical protein
MACVSTTPPEQKPRAPTTAYSQSALRGSAREYVAPDHAYGESFPGKQAPTVQLSLFDAGVTNAVEGFPKKCSVKKPDKS